MPDRKLATDVAKDQISSWILNALKCELFPREGDSLANVELPEVEHIAGSTTCRSLGDENHVITLTLTTGKVISILVKHGDYRMVLEGAEGEKAD